MGFHLSCIISQDGCSLPFVSATHLLAPSKTLSVTEGDCSPLAPLVLFHRLLSHCDHASTCPSLPE